MQEIRIKVDTNEKVATLIEDYKTNKDKCRENLRILKNKTDRN